MTDKADDLHDALNRPTPSWSELRERVNHADKAYETLNSAPYTGDPAVVKAMIEAASVHAKLAVADKIEELTQTVKLCTSQVIDAQAKLDEHVQELNADLQTAAQHLHRDAGELKAHLTVINGEAAA